MLHSFVQFVQWPQQAPVVKDSGLVIGVYGYDQLQKQLSSLAASPGEGWSIEVVQIDSLKDLAMSQHELHVLYIAASNLADMAEILRTLQGAPILTVCDDELFVKQGGMMNFVRQNSRVRFDINLDAATQGHLKINSRLHGLARVIIKNGAAQEKR